MFKKLAYYVLKRALRNYDIVIRGAEGERLHPYKLEYEWITDRYTVYVDTKTASKGG